MIDYKLRQWISNYIKQSKPLTPDEQLIQEYFRITGEHLKPRDTTMVIKEE